MRKRTYLSPTQLSMWMQNKEDYYVRYLSDQVSLPMPQNRAMAVGSAFDAYVKAYLHKVVHGSVIDARLDFDDLFQKQVEPQNRDFAIEAGARCFRAYRDEGSLGNIVKLIRYAASVPQMELKLERTVDGVPLLGIPDLVFVTESEVSVILDWKVNGYESKSNTSPVPGYINYKFKMHNDCILDLEGDIEYDLNSTMVACKPDWARQLSTYTWVCGRDVGSPIMCAVDQIVCNQNIHCAAHRCFIPRVFQEETMGMYKQLWRDISEEWIFRDMSKEDNDGRCRVLDGRGFVKMGMTTPTKLTVDDILG